MHTITGALSAILLGTGAAHAVPVVFDLTGGAGEAPSATYAESGLELTVAARAVDGSGAVRPVLNSVVTMNADGLGVRNRVGEADEETNTHVDGKSVRDHDDMLMFTFASRIVAATVTFVERTGFEESRFVTYLASGADLAPAGAARDVDGPALVQVGGTSFGLAALGDDDQFYVSSVSVDAAPTAVPVPGAAGLALLGLGALAALRRR